MAKKNNPFQEIIRWLLENILWDFGKPYLSLILSLINTLFNVVVIFTADKWYIKYLLYFFLIYGFIQIVGEIYSGYCGKKYLPLAKARTEGVILRNDGIGVEDILDAKNWIEAFDQWDKRIIATISSFSKTEGEKFKVINRFNLTPGNLPTRIPAHNRKLNVLEEKLARLEALIEKLEKRD